MGCFKNVIFNVLINFFCIKNKNKNTTAQELKHYVDLRNSFQICKCESWKRLNSLLGFILNDNKRLLIVTKQVCYCSSTFKITASGAILPSCWKSFTTTGSQWPVTTFLPFWGVCSGKRRGLNVRTSLPRCCWHHYLSTWRSFQRTAFKFSVRVCIASSTNGTFGAVILSTWLLMIWHKRIQLNFKYF